MEVCRYHEPGTGPCIGVIDDGKVVNLTSAGLCDSIESLLDNPDRWELGRQAIERVAPSRSLAELDRAPDPEQPHLLAPLDTQEIWACGVTYRRSRDARVLESADADIYLRVYLAERPEIFFKSTPHRTVGPNMPVTVRADSTWNVPEPELALLLTPELAIAGYTIGNDVSSRSIEGENPLYLPQAKVWSGACAVGPVVKLATPGDQPPTFEILLTIQRQGETVFAEAIATDQMQRPLDQLISYLGRANHFPTGVILLTGTGIVPPDAFSLQPGDLVEITIPGIGTLRNPVALAG